MVRAPKIQCQVNPPCDSELPADLIKKIIKKTLALLKIKKADLSLTLIGFQKIKGLNKVYRGKNSVTDVLSFPYYYKKDYLAGEIVICWPQVKKNAQKYKIPIKAELKRVLVHSLLHLVGYDHQKAKGAKLMRKKEEAMLLILS
jgi:probable rRNA maturation factor